MEIPYRLDSIESINAAKREDLLKLGKSYKLMLLVARNVQLSYPQAFRNARKSVKKDFTVINEETICKTDIRYEEISDIDLAGNLERIEAKIPWLRGMACHESIFQYIETFTPDVKGALGVERASPSPTKMLDAHLALRRLIKRDPPLREDGPDEIGGTGLSEETDSGYDPFRHTAAGHPASSEKR